MNKTMRFDLGDLGYIGVYDEQNGNFTGSIRDGAKTAHVSLSGEKWLRVRVENTSGGSLRVTVNDGGKRLPYMFDLVEQYAFVWVRTRIRTRSQVIRVSAQPIEKSSVMPEALTLLGTQRKPYSESFAERASTEYTPVGKKVAFRFVFVKK